MTVRHAKEQVQRLKRQGCFEPMVAAAKKHGLPLAFVCAIASRETSCDNILGDWRDGAYHGVGVMQIDIQHEIARQALAERTWRDHPGPLIEFGCGLLAVFVAKGRDRFPELDEEGRLRCAAAAYNTGWVNAFRGHQEGNCDKFTTHHNYGQDVVGRMAAFQKALEGEEQ